MGHLAYASKARSIEYTNFKDYRENEKSYAYIEKTHRAIEICFGYKRYLKERHREQCTVPRASAC